MPLLLCLPSAVRAAFLALGSTMLALLGTVLAAWPVAAHGGVPLDPPSAAALLLGWTIEPLVAMPLLAALVGWWWLVRRVDRSHPDRPVAALQRWAFPAGLLAIAVALLSGLAAYDTTLFSIHMGQHLLLSMVAPPLLALGAPITQLLRAAPASSRTGWIMPVLHSRPARVLAHPVVVWLVFSAVMWGTHFSPLFDRSLEDPLVHDLEHGLFLGAGLLFWWPVVSLDPAPHRMKHPARLLYLFLQMPQNSFLAMAVLFAGTPLYPHYASLGSPFGITALADQQLAAGLMWFVGDVIFLIALFAVLADWMRSEGRGAAAADRRADPERERIRGREAALRRRRAGDGEAQPGTGEVSNSR